MSERPEQRKLWKVRRCEVLTVVVLKTYYKETKLPKIEKEKFESYKKMLNSLSRTSFSLLSSPETCLREARWLDHPL